MYSGRGRARGHSYYNAPEFYINISQIYTNRTQAPYSVPLGLAVVPRVVASSAALGAAALLQTVPAVAAPVATTGRGWGRRGTPSHALNSRNVSNVRI